MTSLFKCIWTENDLVWPGPSWSCWKSEESVSVEKRNTQTHFPRVMLLWLLLLLLDGPQRLNRKRRSVNKMRRRGERYTIERCWLIWHPSNNRHVVVYLDRADLVLVVDSVNASPSFIWFLFFLFEYDKRMAYDFCDRRFPALQAKKKMSFRSTCVWKLHLSTHSSPCCQKKAKSFKRFVQYAALFPV